VSCERDATIASKARIASEIRREGTRNSFASMPQI
jgi:hypothetical protein